MVHQHLDGTISLTHGPHRLERYSVQGEDLKANKNGRRTLWKKRAVESPKADFSPALGNPANSAGFPLSTSDDGYGI